MGFFSSVIGGFTGSTQAKAARAGAAIQSAAADKAITTTEEATERAISGIQPFADVGATGLTDLGALVTDPERQRQFIEENPFFDALREQATTSLLQTQAAGGKVGSGETQAELDKRILTIGSDLLARDISQRTGLANIGFAGAEDIANIETGQAANISNLITGQGAASAAGLMGAANARAAGAKNIINLGSKIAGVTL